MKLTENTETKIETYIKKLAISFSIMTILGIVQLNTTELPAILKVLIAAPFVIISGGLIGWVIAKYME